MSDAKSFKVSYAFNLLFVEERSSYITKTKEMKKYSEAAVITQ